MTRHFTTSLRFALIWATLATVAAGAATAAADQRVTRFIYNADGELARSVDAVGLVTNYRYGPDGRLRLRSDSAGRFRETEYDARGLPITRTDQRSDGLVAARTRYRYDPRGFLAEQSSGRVSRRTESDAIGNPVAEYDGNGNRAQHTTYDSLNRTVSMIDPAGGSTLYDYDNASNLRRVVGPTSIVTRYRWDDFGNRVLETGRDRGAVRYTFDVANNLSRRTDARRVTAQHRYDALDRPVGVDFPGTNYDISYTWDSCPNGRGHLCEVVEAQATTRFAYDAWGNVSISTVRTNAQTFTTRYGYDRENRITRLTYPNGRVVIYGRDAAGRIITVDTILGGRRSRLVVARRYRADGKVVHQRRLGGLRELRSYDEAGLQTSLTVDRAGQVLVEGALSFDGNRNVTGIDFGLTRATYTYDSLNRMVSDERTGSNPGTHAFTYDSAGNRTAVNINGNRRPVQHKAGSNQLTRSHRGKLQVDGAGYVRSDRNGTRRFVWDPRGNLKTITRSGKTIASYEYDYRSLRLSKSLPGQNLRRYVYDQKGRLLAEYENGRWVRDFVWLDRELLVQSELRAMAGRLKSVETSQFVVDHLPQPRIVFDQRGAKKATLAPTGFGETASADTVSRGYPIRFPGHYLDTESGLHYNWHRYYDPTEGRYLSSDPLGLFDGLNTYTYAHSRPLVEVDPTGLRTCGAGWNEPLVPDAPFGYQFSDCCETHDECYGTCDPSLTRSDCDGTFCSCMDNECASAHGGAGVCRFLSGTYCKSVRRYGQNFFNTARSTCTECN